MALFQGSGVAIITPMKDNYEVNYDKLEELINDQIAHGTDAIIITGTTGESSTLTEEEHSECIRAAVAMTKKRVPVIAGTGSNCTATAISLSQDAQRSGADGLLVVTPYYNKATQKGLINHYSKIAASVDLPIILYNVPGRTGCNVQPATVAALAKDVENIVGIKDATGDITNALRIMQLTDGDFELYSGEDGMVVPLLSAGGIGVISVLANVAPQYVHDMVMSYLEGDPKKALKMQLDAIPMCDALFCEVNPIPVKTALNLMGFEVGPLREPLCEMEPAHVSQLVKAMEGFGIPLVNQA